jgi:sterol desaturase/sphingolipid hydroxylase (fatty acid hydroxylase superfamily)
MQFNSILNKLIEVFSQFKIDPQVFLIQIATMLAALVIEAFYTGLNKSSLYRFFKAPTTSAKIDLISWVLSVTRLFQVFAFIMSMGIAWWFFGFINKQIDLQFLRAIQHPFLQFLAATALYDLFNYFKHRLSHHLDWYWQLHQYHHSANEMTVLTAHRTHFLEEVADNFLRAIPFAILGAPIESFLWFTVLKEIQQNLHHSKVNANWGFIGRWIFVSPAGHRLHHSLSPAHFGKNFASIFVIWDRLFNTYHAPEPVLQFGVKDDFINKISFLGGILKSSKNSLSSILKI